jgi:cysteinyl-tRNA synthetase
VITFYSLDEARKGVHDALCDSFNTPLAMSTIIDLISKTNLYLRDNEKTPVNPNAYLSIASVKEIARWITRLLDIFGLDGASSTANGGDRIGWSTSQKGESSNAEETAMPYVRVLSKYRDQVKKLSISNPNDSISKELLSISDTVRDDLVPLGVSLEDRNSANDEPALVKFVSPTELIATREEKRKIAAEREGNKEKARLERERLEAEKLDKSKLSHLEMFKTEEYEEWDENGLPIKEKGARKLPSRKARN